MTDKVITISMEEYDALVERDRFLAALESAGVDNWNGFGMAHNIFEGRDGDDWGDD